MTKVTVLNENSSVEKKELKKIEVTKMLLVDGETINHSTDLSQYNDLKIIKINGFKGFDCIILASPRMVFLGNFNDGIV